MKNLYILLAVIISAILVGLSFFLFTGKDSNYESAFMIDEGGTLVLRNLGNNDIKIITSDSREIVFNLIGSPDAISKIRFFRLSDNYIEFELPEGFIITGTIIIPNDIIIEKTNLLGALLFDMNEKEEAEKNGGSSSDFFGEPNGDGQQNNLVNTEDDEENNLNNNLPNTVDGNTVTPSNPVTPYTPTPNPNGNTNNAVDTEEEDDNENINDDTNDNIDDENQAESIPCSLGTDAIKNDCCKNLMRNMEDPVDCIGVWEFSNLLVSCSYECLTDEELDDYFSRDSIKPGDVTAASDICKYYSTSTSRSECCEDYLSNDLSMGPRPGFPDCLGKWKFNDENDKCEFHCATHEEKLIILEELKDRQLETRE